MAGYTVYILRSTKTKRFYIGFTIDIKRRLLEHNSGKVTSTKNRGPYEIVYKEISDSREEALMRERYFKNMKRELLKRRINLEQE